MSVGNHLDNCLDRLRLMTDARLEAVQEKQRQRKRGDSYRARALAMVTHCRGLRVEVRSQLTALKIGECLDVAAALSERYNANLAASEARYAAALEHGEQVVLRAEAATALLATMRQWHGHAQYCEAKIMAENGEVDMALCDCGWRELAAETDALLAERAAR